MLDENNRIILTSKLVPKLSYRAQDTKILLLHFTKSLKRDNIYKYCVCDS